MVRPLTAKFLLGSLAWQVVTRVAGFKSAAPADDRIVAWHGEKLARLAEERIKTIVVE